MIHEHLSSPHEHAGKDGARILIVEDDEETIEVLSTQLRSFGYGVDIATTGEDAIAQITANLPDLILLDLKLPDMDGVAITERIRSLTYGSPPIIMLTAADQHETKLRSFDAGADDFVSKPYSSAELLARIAVHLRRNQAVRSLEDQAVFLTNALAIMAGRQQQTASSFELERKMRVDLLHSVNTHLQALCAIFDVEFRRQPPGAGREVLQRVIPRLRGAALIYKISEALTAEHVDLGDLVRTVAGSLKDVYSPRKRIPVTIEATRLVVPSTIASPLIMATNELITNAFKHAFPQGRFGAITVKCSAQDNGIRLTIEDDGVGFAHELASTGRGLTTVRHLTDELGGAFDIQTDPAGTRATLRVPLPPPSDVPGNDMPGELRQREETYWNE